MAISKHVVKSTSVHYLHCLHQGDNRGSGVFLGALLVTLHVGRGVEGTGQLPFDLHLSGAAGARWIQGGRVRRLIQGLPGFQGSRGPGFQGSKVARFLLVPRFQGSKVPAGSKVQAVDIT